MICLKPRIDEDELRKREKRASKRKDNIRRTSRFKISVDVCIHENRSMPSEIENARFSLRQVSKKVIKSGTVYYQSPEQP